MDDDPAVLQVLRHALADKRSEWEMEFASGGNPASDLMLQQAFDAVVAIFRCRGWTALNF